MLKKCVRCVFYYIPSTCARTGECTGNIIMNNRGNCGNCIREITQKKNKYIYKKPFQVNIMRLTNQKRFQKSFMKGFYSVLFYFFENLI